MIEHNSINTVTTICIYGENDAILSFLMPKPPVPAVPNEWTTLSNRFIPPKSRNTVSITVSAI